MNKTSNAPQEERFDEVDRSGRVIATHPKSELKRRMFMHQVALVIPRAEGRKFLLSKRAKHKQPFADSWCCGVGGKVNSGETPETAAPREMLEEVGKTYPLEKVVSFVYDEKDYKAIFTVFTTKAPISPDELKLDPEEVQYTKAVNLSDVLLEVDAAPEKFAPTFIAAIKAFAKNIQQ